MGQEGGGEGQVGQGSAVAGQSDWEAPVPEGRFPLAVNYQLMSYLHLLSPPLPTL